MKKLYKNIGTLALISLASFALSGCGDNAYMKESGIISCGNGDDLGLSVAIHVQPSSEIQKMQEDTTLRVWHYPNKDKLVCIVSGSAKFIKGGEVL